MRSARSLLGFWMSAANCWRVHTPLKAAADVGSASSQAEAITLLLRS